MNKSEIKQIILEEIESALSEMQGGPDMSVPARAGELLYAVMPFEEDMMEEEDLSETGRSARYQYGPKASALSKRGGVPMKDPFDPKGKKVITWKGDWAEMSPEQRAPLVARFLVAVRDEFDRINQEKADNPDSDTRGRRKAALTDDDIKNLAAVFSKDEFTSDDIKDAIGRFRDKKRQQANAWIAILKNKKWIENVESKQTATKTAPARVGSEPGSKERMDSFKDFMQELVKKQIQEAKNPLANRMKEIENQGRIAALETKLGAISEFIEETQARLTRVDEDEEFNEMMDKSKVKEVRKQLKELEKAKLKLEKEMAKMDGKGKKKLVTAEPEVEEGETNESMDEMGGPDDVQSMEDMLDGFYDGDGEPFELNESMLRMQKLAGLITESDIKKKLISEINIDQILDPLVSSGDKASPDEYIGQILSTRDSIELDKISGDYLAQVYNFDDYKNLNITPRDVENALSQLKVVKVTDGGKLVSDFDLGGFGEYVLIDYNGNKYLSSDGGRYITAIK